MSLVDRVRVAEPQGRDEGEALLGYPQEMVPLEESGLGSAQTLEGAGRKLGPGRMLVELLAARTLEELLAVRMLVGLLSLLADHMPEELLVLLAGHMPEELLVLLPVHTLVGRGLPVHMLVEQGLPVHMLAE